MQLPLMLPDNKNGLQLLMIIITAGQVYVTFTGLNSVSAFSVKVRESIRSVILLLISVTLHCRAS